MNISRWSLADFNVSVKTGSLQEIPKMTRSQHSYESVCSLDVFSRLSMLNIAQEWFSLFTSSEFRISGNLSFFFLKWDLTLVHFCATIASSQTSATSLLLWPKTKPLVSGASFAGCFLQSCVGTQTQNTTRKNAATSPGLLLSSERTTKLTSQVQG